MPVSDDFDINIEGSSVIPRIKSDHNTNLTESASSVMLMTRVMFDIEIMSICIVDLAESVEDSKDLESIGNYTDSGGPAALMLTSGSSAMLNRLSCVTNR